VVNDNRLGRHKGRAALRMISKVKACRDCGRVTVSASGEVGVRLSDGRAGYAGLATCGRIWLCPVCNSKIMARRALEIAVALAWAHAEGHWVIWGSLTTWHNASSRLRPLLDVQRAGWRRIVQSRRWAETRSLRPGYIRAAEITVGVNGYHPHFHPLVLWAGTESAGRDLAGRMVADWIEGVTRAGGKAGGRGAQQLELLEPERAYSAMAGYLTKAQYDPRKLGLEAVWSQSKTGTGRVHGTESHWSLLNRIAQGDPDAVDQWHEIETATKGHRAITWSRGLRDLAGVGAEAADETVAAEETGTLEDTVCYLTADGWRSIRDAPTITAGLLRVLETGGWAALRLYLDEFGIEYRTL